MSVTEKIKQEVQKTQRGKPFTNSRFLRLGSRSAVDKTLSRLVEEGTIQRATRGVFFRPKKSRFVSSVMPEASQVIEAITKDRGETIQIHGAEAARRFKISTQMPGIPVYYTSGPTREIKVGKLKVKLIHTFNHRKLQHAGKKTGMALAALWYLGKTQINAESIARIREGLSEEEFETLRASSVPEWMAQAINTYGKETAHA